MKVDAVQPATDSGGDDNKEAVFKLVKILLSNS
jgi:hypothetical protein